MTWKLIIPYIAAVAVIALGAALGVYTSPTFASELPLTPATPATCNAPEGLIASPQVKVVDDFKATKSSTFDRIIIVQFEQIEFIWFFKDGCSVGMAKLGDLPVSATPTAAAADCGMPVDKILSTPDVKIIDDFASKAPEFDRVLVATHAGKEWIVLIKKDCVVNLLQAGILPAAATSSPTDEKPDFKKPMASVPLLDFPVPRPENWLYNPYGHRLIPT